MTGLMENSSRGNSSTATRKLASKAQDSTAVLSIQADRLMTLAIVSHQDNAAKEASMNDSRYKEDWYASAQCTYSCSTADLWLKGLAGLTYRAPMLVSFIEI